MATERIVIIISENGTDTVIRKLGGIGDAAKKSSSSVDFLKNALQAIGSAQVLRQAQELLDTYQNIQNRLKVVTGSSDELKFATQELFEVANRSRASFENTAELYARLSLASDQLKVSHSQLARVTETLNKATLLSGANTREANAALLQLSQGLASNAVKGDNLRSVLEQIPYVADIIAQKMGVTRGALKLLGSEGKVTSEIVIQALLDAGDKVDEAFGKTVPTIENSFQTLKNKILEVVGTLNDKYQIINKVTTAVQILGDNVETIGRVAFAGVLTLGILKAVGAVDALTAALAANPIGLVAVAIVAGVAALVAFSDQITIGGGSLATLADLAKTLWADIAGGIRFVAEEFAKKFGFIGDYFKQIFGTEFQFSIKGFLQIFAKAIDSAGGIVRALIDGITSAWKNLGGLLELITKEIINKILHDVEAMINGLISTINSLATTKLGQKAGLNPISLINLGRLEASPEAIKAGANVGFAFINGFKSVTGAQDYVKDLLFRTDQNAQQRIKLEAERAIKEKEALEKGKAEFDKQNSPKGDRKGQADIGLDNILSRLKAEGEAYKETSYQREISMKLIREEEELKRKNIPITDETTKALRAQLEYNQAQKERSDVLDSVQGRLDENARKQAILNDVIREGGKNVAEYTHQLRQLQIDQLLSSREATDGFKAGFLEVQDEITNFGEQASKTVTDAFHGMEDAIVDFVQTGKFSFSSLVDSILADLTRLLLRQAITGLASSFGGPIGGIFSAFAGRAAGGDVEPGKAYTIGERGPETFIPHVAGTVVPTGGGIGAPPQVHVSVVNVTDPNEVARVMSDPKNDHIILNALTRNRQAVKQMQGR
jgi:lambda family phage tail tape measure protein